VTLISKRKGLFYKRETPIIHAKKRKTGGGGGGGGGGGVATFQKRRRSVTPLQFRQRKAGRKKKRETPVFAGL